MAGYVPVRLRPSRWRTLRQPTFCACCGVRLDTGGRGYHDPAHKFTLCGQSGCPMLHAVPEDLWR